MKNCPFCAEEIQDEAIKCKHCGSMLNGKEPVRPEKPQPVEQKEKKSRPLVVGCLVLVILFTLLSIVGSLAKSCGGPSPPRSSGAKKETPVVDEDKRRAQDAARYQAGKRALEKGDYSRAEMYFNQVSKDYEDVQELLAHPEIKKAAEARVAEEKAKARMQSLRSVYVKSPANIRAGPGTEHDVVRKAQSGQSLKYEKLQGEWYKLGTVDGDAEWIHSSVVMTEGEKRRRDSADLYLLSWRWGTQHGFATAEGRVKNVSGRALENVTVVIHWETNSGTFITSEECLIDYNPILSGQASPFSCSASANPAMHSASIDFKTLFGGSLSWYKE